MTEAGTNVAGNREKKRSLLIVGMGASAGGLEALQQFFAGMPDNSNLAFVVIQHLSPDYRSLMAEILGKHTGMKVVQAENGMPVQPDVVFLIPPGKNMTVKDGRLLLAEQAHGAVNHPIDLFFTSLAEEKRELALAVVLSGTGSDGTGGIKAVKEHGGLVFVQEPKSARFDGMPRSAIGTGLADFVLSPENIAAELLNFSHYPAVAAASERSPLLSGNEELLARIYMILKRVSGIDFTHYKRNTVLRRIERRMVVTRSATPADFARLIEENPAEASQLVKDILIGVTRFFRDAEFFETLKATAVTAIIEQSDEDTPVRVWSAGCSTGEEAYSLAMLFREVLEERHLRRDVKIFATDVDTRAIEQAGKGVFPESIADDVSPERLARFFVRRNDQYQVTKDIR
ncbi:chemotaxis protein CheB, partial [uncultured Mailhella sp.]|uniref:chemotaxis protein CheB n=1 Tax=uncultured Mailhella sp. TaxID=1981031 RepID=UPI0025E5E983